VISVSPPTNQAPLRSAIWGDEDEEEPTQAMASPAFPAEADTSRTVTGGVGPSILDYEPVTASQKTTIEDNPRIDTVSTSIPGLEFFTASPSSSAPAHSQAQNPALESFVTFEGDNKDRPRRASAAPETSSKGNPKPSASRSKRPSVALTSNPPTGARSREVWIFMAIVIVAVAVVGVGVWWFFVR
jgi:hypothetical protein